jgi:hypothetical protein
VVRVCDPDELLWLSGKVDGSFDGGHGAELIVIAADEELGLEAVAQEIVLVSTAFRLNGKPQSNEAGDAGVSATGAEADVRTERESGEKDGEVELAVEPVESGAYVVLLAAAVVMGAFAEPGSAKVETQYRETEGLERLHGVIDDLVVHGAAAEGMRVTDERGIGRFRCASVEESLETACRTTEIVDGAEDCGADVRVGHPVSLYEEGSGILVLRYEP